MELFYLQRMRGLATTAAALSCLVAAAAQNSQATAPNVTYAATGTFATTPTSGADLFKLAGQAFSMSVVANAATVPTTHGPTWAKYTKLKMTGSVQSALLTTPTPLGDNNTSIELAMGNPSYNVFSLFSPVMVLKLQINIQATIQMPVGTITKPLIHPFSAPVTLGPSTGTVTYSEPSTGASTVLAIASGTLTATITGAGTNDDAVLHTAGMRAIEMPGDTIQPVLSLLAPRVALAGNGETVALQLDASGVRGASDVRASIAGEGSQWLCNAGLHARDRRPPRDPQASSWPV